MFEDLKEIYNGKKVFLTGHTGFKGSWMLKILDLLGAQVTGYALEPQNDFDLFHTLNGNELCNSITGDIRNRQMLTQAVLDAQPDYVFHLAAQPLVRVSYELPAQTIEVNTIGTANILDAVRVLDKPCNVVMITTDKVYHNNEWDYPYRENDRLGGYDPYSASKACAELVIDSYRNSFFNLKRYDEHRKAVAVGRAGNVIGGGDWSKDRLVPDIARALSANETVIIRSPHAVRPWQHVLEPLFGYLWLGAKITEDPKKYVSEYNFGPEFHDALPVDQMIKAAIGSWGSGNYVVEQNEHQPHEAGLLKLDISKAMTVLDWKPRLNAQQAIAKTMAWYKEFLHNPHEIVSFTEQQIMEFINDPVQYI